MRPLERSENNKGLRPPLRLEISLLDLGHDLEKVDVHAYVGTYRTMHRSVVVARDALDEIPLTVEADLYKWIAWLLKEQQERCKPEHKRNRLPLNRHPQWPSPEALWRSVPNEEALPEAT